jgi:hypothetical protein
MKSMKVIRNTKSILNKCEPKNFSELRKSDREMQSDQAQIKHRFTGDLADSESTVIPFTC